LEDFDGERYYAEYDNFKVDNEAAKYKLVSLGEYSGDAGETVCSKGAITSKIKLAVKLTIKLKTSSARLAQLLQPSLAFCF